MHPAYFPVFFWSLFIFASFLGYGETLRRALKRSEFDDLGWGLTAAWGMAVTLAIGGLLMTFKLAIAPILTAVIVLGAALAVLHGVTHLMAGRFSLSSFRLSLADLVLYLLAALAFASSIAWPNHIDPNDDLICYLMLPEKLLCTGTLIEPFSFQRAGTYGGQAILQALVMIVGAERNGHVPDRGIAMVMMFGMLVHATRGLRGQQAIVRFLLLFAFWFVPVPRISTNGAMTGGCLILGMLETMQRAYSANTRRWSLFVPVGLLLAGACSIRPTFTVMAGFILAALAVRELWIARRSGSTLMSAITPFLTIGLTALAILIPFMVTLYASNGTPMVPPISGYVSKAYQTYSFEEPIRNIFGTLTFFTAPEALCMLALLAIAALYPVKQGTSAILWGTILASGLILHRFSALAFLDQYRYLYPILVPLAFWFIAAVLKKSAAENPADSANEPIRMPIAASSAALLVFMVVNASQGGKELGEQVKGLPDQIKEVKPFFDPGLKKAYSELQELVPAGEKILTMVDASYWLDYKRNPMFSINAVGGSSPPPGLPFEQGPNALASYLKGLGIRYVIAVDFDNAVLLYTRKLWNESTRPEWFYTSIWKPRFNDFMDNIDALAAQDGRLLAKAGNARLIDLGQ
jgi:hypothetical protein